ncbi:Chromosome 5 4, partial [Mortierella sp. GBA30]
MTAPPSSELKHEDPDLFQDDTDQVPAQDEWGPVVSHHKAPFEFGDVFFYAVLISLFFGGLHLYGEKFWTYILATYPKPVIFLGGSFIVSQVGFWFWVSLLAILDLYQFPKSFWRYKIQPLKVPTWEWYTKALWVVLQNQFLVGVPTGLVLYKLMEWRGNSIGMDLPTVWDLAKESIGFLVVEEIGFYYGHRLLHHPRFYKRIHKQHHLYTAPIGIAGQQDVVDDVINHEHEILSLDQHSLRSVSTFDLPSPALSSRDAEKPDKKTDKTSWVWQWAEKRVDAA